MYWLKTLLLAIFRDPSDVHTWWQIDDLRRRCTVCGRVEKYDEIGSISGTAWDVLRDGDRKAHRK